MLCSVSLRLALIRGIDILFENSTPEIWTEFKKHPLPIMPLGIGIHTKPVFFLNVFSGDLHFESFFIGLC